MADENERIERGGPGPVEGSGINAYDLIAEVDSYHIVSWSPGDTSKGDPCTQVHFVQNIAGIEATFLTRFKSQRAINELIAALEEHRDYVWPETGLEQRRIGAVAASLIGIRETDRFALARIVYQTMRKAVATFGYSEDRALRLLRVAFDALAIHTAPGD